MHKVEGLIILGGGISEEGKLSISTITRLEKALEICRSSVVSHILLSGRWSFWGNTSPKKTEALAMKEYLLVHGGINFEKIQIILEENSLDTIGNAYSSEQIVTERNWSNLTVITSHGHLERSMYIFDKFFTEKVKIAYVAAEDAGGMDREAEEKVFKYTKKILGHIKRGDHHELETVIYEQHPAYAKGLKKTKEQILQEIMAE